jgi:hypothetical protein
MKNTQREDRHQDKNKKSGKMLHTRGWHEMKLRRRSFGKGETNGGVGWLDNLHRSRYLRRNRDIWGEAWLLKQHKVEKSEEETTDRCMRLGGYRSTTATTFVSNMCCVGTAM